MLDFMKIPLKKNAGSLSRGLRARLRLVLAFSWDAELTLLDEPFSGIDPASREKIVEGILMSYSRTTTKIKIFDVRGR
jgi:ABC-2 type transport system ATP-binding protein